jgi:hypothetical protein
MKKRGKEKAKRTQEAVWNVLSEKDGNEMLYSDLTELVSNWTRYSLTGKAVASFLRKQVNAGYIVKSRKRSDGMPETYWRLECDSLETFIK